MICLTHFPIFYSGEFLGNLQTLFPELASAETSLSTIFENLLTIRGGVANAMSWKKLSKLVEQDIPLVWLRIVAILSILAAIPAMIYCCWYVFGFRMESETEFYKMSGLVTLIAVAPMIYLFLAPTSYSNEDRANLFEKGWVKHPAKKDEELSRRWSCFFMPTAPIAFFLVGFGYQIWGL